MRSHEADPEPLCPGRVCQKQCGARLIGIRAVNPQSARGEACYGAAWYRPRCSMLQTTVQHGTVQTTVQHGTDHSAAWYRPQCSMLQTTVQHGTKHGAACHRRCSRANLLGPRSAVSGTLFRVCRLVVVLNMSLCLCGQNLLRVLLQQQFTGSQ